VRFRAPDPGFGIKASHRLLRFLQIIIKVTRAVMPANAGIQLS
jgi:hypothetical protein